MIQKPHLSALLLWTALAGSVAAQAPVSSPAPTANSPQPLFPIEDHPPVVVGDAPAWTGPTEDRPFLASDRAFPGFIGPISNPILSKDPRSLTEARLLFVNDVLPSNTALGGGDFQVYAMQLRVALTDRLSLIADKDGIASIQAHALSQRTGVLNFNFGMKYLIVRDVEDQFLWSAGFTYEPPMGERNVFQNYGNGIITAFTTVGQEIACNWHVLNTFGCQFGLEDRTNSDFFYNSLHIDRQFFGWVYPLVELNWFHYTHGGDHGLPPSLGEGDGLLNLGTTGVAGNDLVTTAFGMKFKLSPNAITGVAWEIPLTGRHDLIGNRLLAELILRY